MKRRPLIDSSFYAEFQPFAHKVSRARKFILTSGQETFCLNFPIASVPFEPIFLITNICVGRTAVRIILVKKELGNDFTKFIDDSKLSVLYNYIDSNNAFNVIYLCNNKHAPRINIMRRTV